MSSDYDSGEFVDGDLQAHRAGTHSPVPASSAAPAASQASRAPTREEVDSRVVDAQQKLAELKRAQEELERERAALEETHRRQNEFQSGRQEMMQNITRGIGLLEEAEFNARRDAEQMAKILADFRDATSKIQAISEESWTKENFSMELTRALTTLENARMEWNAAKLKFPVLTNSGGAPGASGPGAFAGTPLMGGKRDFREMCLLGLALTGPLAVVALLAFVTLLFLLTHK